MTRRRQGCAEAQRHYAKEFKISANIRLWCAALTLLDILACHHSVTHFCKHESGISTTCLHTWRYSFTDCTRPTQSEDNRLHLANIPTTACTEVEGLLAVAPKLLEWFPTAASSTDKCKQTRKEQRKHTNASDRLCAKDA